MKQHVLSENESKLSIMLFTIKFAIIAFIGIIVYSNIPLYWGDLNIKDNGQFNLCSTALFLGVTGILCIVWIMVNKEITQSFNVFKISWLIENIFFIPIISLPIYLSSTYDSGYKYLYLLLIIAVVIQYGSKYGILTSIFCAFFVLTSDLLYCPVVEGVNIYFQKDLITSGVFIFVAWVLAFYVDIENENNVKTQNQLNKLSTELEKQNTNRLNIELSLLKNKICYDMLIENSINAIIVHKNGNILYANESAAKLMGYKNLTQLNKKSFYNHYSEEDTKFAQQKYVDISENKLSKVIYEETILNCEGEAIAVRNTSSYFVYEGSTAVLTFLFDLTSEKQLETLKDDVEKNLKLLNESKEFNILITEFFTNISHEIKTPINVIYVAIQSISMYLEQYSNENIDKCKSYLKTMKQNCFRMIRLVNNLLDITKSDSGFSKLNRKNGNIVSVVEDITQSVAAYVKSKDIELIFDTNVEEKIMAFDHDKIERIMLNLLSNAFKYTNADGQIMVVMEDKQNEVTITVKDDGEGIPKEKLDVIFERFGQANRSLSRQSEGSGIGLYLVKSFVELHGGNIIVNSSERMGTEFVITLPVQVMEEENYKNNTIYETNIERINIEFSDVYSISFDK